jgi:adenosylhomocysteine nucleosidase
VARRAAIAVIERYSPDVVISAGFVGALTPTLKVGDVVTAGEVVDAASGNRFAASGGESAIATVSSVSGPDEKRWLADRWGADVVDMEAAAVAAVAHEKGVEFASIKSVSDELDFVMPPVAQFVDKSGKFETMRFAIHIALRPKWWSVVRQLNTNSQIAALNLSEALKHLIDYRSQIVRGEVVTS